MGLALDWTGARAAAAGFQEPGARHDTPGEGGADPWLAPAPAQAQAAPATPTPLGLILLGKGALDPNDMLRALQIQKRHNARMGDILRAHGMASAATISAALAEQHRTALLGRGDLPPDPRLIALLGPRECLRLRCLPWRRAGSLTLVATADPSGFERHRPQLEAALGPLAMAVIPDDLLDEALEASQRSKLHLMAETCVKSAESCRDWNARNFGLGVIAILLSIGAGLILSPSATLVALFAVVFTALVLGTGLKIAAALSALQARRERRRARAIAQPPGKLPVISVLVPLYNEPDIANRLVKRLGALTYPRELLDVLLVVEEEDEITRAALARARLPHWIRMVVVPDSLLRTKPRALNYALNFARGSLVGVYDAEDAPAPDQLHRVAGRFATAGPDLACIQGVLDYYNPRTNWLARCFTIEYAAWFRLMLPGLERLGLVVPLGGTTLFFRRDTLEALGGWDAHNVTEDADLGVRLARHGYRTELLETVTLEEANCRLWPWIKQRSRWLKGYAMTYGVHMRDPVLLWRQLGPRRFFGFQLLFLGTLIQFLLAPVLWSFWIMLFGFGHPLAATLPGWFLWGVAGTFVLAEAVSLAINIAALNARDHRFLRLWAPTLHFYFPLAALAAYKALWEMVRSPFFWDKTVHGLHDTQHQPAVTWA
jgi:cellulose synthase/poly-beta-1,6-N-acetylglucosamine synthase-like glycosyltransferase